MICGFLVSEPSFAGALWAFCGPGNHSRLASPPQLAALDRSSQVAAIHKALPVDSQSSPDSVGRHAGCAGVRSCAVSAADYGWLGQGPLLRCEAHTSSSYAHLCHDYRRPRLMCRLSITIYMAACTKSPPYSNLSALVSNGTSYAAITRMGRSVGDPFAVRIRALTAPSCGPPCAN